MGLLNDYMAQVQDYKKAGSIGLGLLDDRPNLELGREGLLNQMQAAEAKYMERVIDPVPYYRANPSAEGLLTVSPELDLLDAITGGGKMAAGQAMFMGARALQAPKQALAMAQKMRHANLDPSQIKKLTGSEFDFKGNQMWELNDANSRLVPEQDRMERSFRAAVEGNDMPVDSLGGLLDHPELYKNYPDLASMNVQANYVDEVLGGKRGTGGATYNPQRDSIDIDSELFEQGRESDLKGLLLHEVQHSIQNRENLPTGASPKNMQRQLSLSASKENRPNAVSESVYQDAMSQLVPMDMAETVSRLDKLSKTTGLKPSRINNLSEFYEHSTGIRDLLGPMPKKAGGQRDEWIQSAFAYIKNRNVDKLNPDGVHYLRMLEDDPKQFSKIKRQKSKERDLARDGAKSAIEVRNRYEDLGLLTSKDAYKASTGERVARSTQAREGLSDRSRRNSLFKDWDIPNYNTPKDIEWALLPSDAYGSYRPFEDYVPK